MSYLLIFIYNLITIKKNRSLFFGITGLFFSAVILSGVFIYTRNLHSKQSEKNISSQILGTVEQALAKSSPTPVSSPSPTHTPVPTLIPYTLSLMNAPDEITQGDTATFTWNINGPVKIIHSTTIYYGQVSSSAALGNQVLPTDTRYTNVVKDFITGDYLVPLQFIANEKFISPGTYFFRAYALIDSDNYWTEEHTLTVKPVPKNEIKVVNYPSEVSPGENIAFTWEIDGPAAGTNFTAIVASKESKPGPMDTSIAVANTSYKIFVNDFANSKSQVPLRFIGNTQVQDPGVYYFRAVANINDRNIWSDEYSFTVKM